ncbi:MAG: HAMP domain-containing protein [Deltaproteobacteria bacterium]|nr:HAMP domain-containing protein [Deltaproteobacteria bacterium]
MKFSIQHKLFMALVAASGLAVLAMFAIMQWSIDRGFLQYVNTLEQDHLQRLSGSLVEAFAREGSWDALRGNPRRVMEILFGSLPDGMPHPEPGPRPEPPPLPGHGPWPPAVRSPVPPPGNGGNFRPGQPPPEPGHPFRGRIFLLDKEQRPVFGLGKIPAEPDLIPLTHQGETIGYLGLVKPRRISDTHQLRFVKSQKLALALVASAVLAVSALFSLPLARRLVKPLQALARAARGLSGGDYALRVPAASSDEMGQLASDFNALALTLKKNEEVRRQWIADISHELRTPLAVLRGEVEALLDGVRPATPEAVASLHTETLRLGRLVDDLYQLSLSDLGGLTYRKEPTDLVELLKGEIDTFRDDFNRKGIAVCFEPPEGRAMLFADPDRLRQLFDNLLENSLKYTFPGGELRIGIEALPGFAQVEFQDSAPGVGEQELPRLFERLYRVEASRSRDSGGAGLGLAICRNIAEAHEGRIEATPSTLGGLGITVTLPLYGKKT